MKIGIIKENKIPIDRRVPFTPEEAKEIQSKFAEVEIGFEASNVRCFPDSDYQVQGIQEVKDLSDCDVLFGVKEVPMKNLIDNKTYFFFSHTIKKQPYNRELLQTVLAKNIRLLDYEMLTNPLGQRIVAFGRYAGLVGAYNGLKTYGERFKLYDLKPAHECLDMQEMFGEFATLQLPAIKIALTGAGRVSNGSVETLQAAGVKQVSPQEYVTQTFDEPVFTQLEVSEYVKRSDGEPFDIQAFYNNPSGHEPNFEAYAHVTDLLISGSYWNPKAPVLFTRKEMQSDDFKIKVIADITCDIQGSIPSTLRATTIDEPVFDYDPQTDEEKPAYSDDKFVSVMSVDNLPCELPRDASRDFGRDLIDQVLPSLVGKDSQGIVKRATITANGKLTERYSYLQDYVDGKE